MRILFSLFVACALGLLLSTAGCDTSVAPYAKTKRVYSVFGYLDAAADTQWVRVEPLQDSSLVGSGPVHANVTLEDLVTGETIALRDSIFGLRFGPEHNFWTDTDLAGGHTYRFRAERRADGQATTAEVTLPPDFPAPEVLNSIQTSNPTPPPVNVLLRGVEKIGSIRVVYDLFICNPQNCKRFQKPVYKLGPKSIDIQKTSEGYLKAVIHWYNHFGGSATLYSAQVEVASVSEDWPEYAEDNPPGGGLDGQILPPPGTTESNIENGAGFLGGAVIRTAQIPITP